MTERNRKALAELREALVARMGYADKAASGARRRIDELEREDSPTSERSRALLEGVEMTHDHYADRFLELIAIIDRAQSVASYEPGECMLCDDNGREANGRPCSVCGVERRAVEASS